MIKAIHLCLQKYAIETIKTRVSEVVYMKFANPSSSAKW